MAVELANGAEAAVVPAWHLIFSFSFSFFLFLLNFKRAGDFDNPRRLASDMRYPLIYCDPWRRGRLCRFNQCLLKSKSIQITDPTRLFCLCFLSTSLLTFLLCSSGTSAVDFLHMLPNLCLPLQEKEQPQICIV